MAATYGRGYLKVPLCRSWRVQLLDQQGWSYTRIARELRISEDAVWKLLRRVRQGEERQMELPIS